MTLTLLAGSANSRLALDVAGKLNVPLGDLDLFAFPDGELHVDVGANVREADVYLLQPTSPPAERHLLELLLLTDACRRAGARRITAVVPYYGYARQDRRGTAQGPVAARLLADLIQASGVDRVLALDLHNVAIEGMFSIPLEHLSAVPVLAAAAQAEMGDSMVVVAPDLGAAKLADRYASLLDLPVAIVHKERLSGQLVEARRITGDVRDRVPIVVDDMISTGGTIESAVTAVREAGGKRDAVVVATHALLVGPAIARLQSLELQRLIVSDTVPLPAESGLPIHIATVAPLLAEAISCLHEGRSLGGIYGR